MNKKLAGFQESNTELLYCNYMYGHKLFKYAYSVSSLSSK